MAYCCAPPLILLIFWIRLCDQRREMLKLMLIEKKETKKFEEFFKTGPFISFWDFFAFFIIMLLNLYCKLLYWSLTFYVWKIEIKILFSSRILILEMRKIHLKILKYLVPNLCKNYFSSDNISQVIGHQNLGFFFYAPLCIVCKEKNGVSFWPFYFEII